MGWKHRGRVKSGQRGGGVPPPSAGSPVLRSHGSLSLPPPKPHWLVSTFPPSHSYVLMPPVPQRYQYWCRTEYSHMLVPDCITKALTTTWCHKQGGRWKHLANRHTLHPATIDAGLRKASWGGGGTKKASWSFWQYWTSVIHSWEPHPVHSTDKEKRV